MIMMSYNMIPIGGGHFLIYSDVTFVVTSITPDTNKNSVDTSVTIIGTEFVDGCTVTIGSTDLTNVNIVNDTTITATIPARISAGTYDIIVTKPDTSIATLSNGFIVTEILDIASINPVSGYNHVDTNIVLYGSKFVDGCIITIDGTSLTNIVFINTFEVTAIVPLGISEGNKDIKLINPDTSNITLTNGFLVKIRTITIAPTNKGSRLRSRAIYNMLS